ncbi:DUF2065 domain-containing protein [Corallincola platygyrae]|uniref:DUF2065 domain-containing protein n=1 Tax=Corallincola platygyrae TaxID=1193278 RepID=A0ABW4XNU8_9GAMM
MLTTGLLIGFALLLVVEGVGPLMFPNRWSRMLRMMSAQRPELLRQIGLVMVSAGLLLLWLILRQKG